MDYWVLESDLHSFEARVSERHFVALEKHFFVSGRYFVLVSGCF